jgi:hypothetical protein
MQSEDIYEIIFINDKKLHKYEINKRQNIRCNLFCKKLFYEWTLYFKLYL